MRRYPRNTYHRKAPCFRRCFYLIQADKNNIQAYMFRMICLYRRFSPLLFRKLPCRILFCLFLYRRTRQNPRAIQQRFLRPRIRIQGDIFSLFSSYIRQAFVRRCLLTNLSLPPCLYIYFQKRNVLKSLYREENIFYLLYF